MADHSKPTNSSLYTNYTTELDARFDDLAVGLDPAVTTATNIPTNTIRWNSVNSYWEKYNGSTWAALDTGYEIDLAGARKILTNSASPALTITQTGSGNALVVEDSASTDSTPFVIDANGQVIVGWPTVIQNHMLQTHTNLRSGIANTYYNANTAGTSVGFYKSKSATVGTNALVSINDTLGNLRFFGADGTDYIEAATISAAVDGTPATNDMPGRLIFSTTASGASSPTERMRIRNDGGVSIGGSGFDSVALGVQKVLTAGAGTSGYGYYITSQIQSNVTANAYLFATNTTVQAASFTLGTLNHFYTVQGTIGAGATVTNQYGFNATSTLIGATNNYGFYSNIPSGTGRWNFYANGTAPNYFNGDVGIGKTTPEAKLDVLANTTEPAVRITQTGTGNAFVVEDSASTDSTPFVIDASGNVGISGQPRSPYRLAVNDTASTAAIFINTSDTASSASVLALARSRTTGGIVSSGDTIGTINFSGDDNSGSFIRAAAIAVAVDGTPGTNDMPGRLIFSTTADGASVPTERLRISSTGQITATGNIAGGYVAHAAGTTAMAFGSYNVVRVTPNATATYTTTVPAAGAIVVLSILTSGTTSYTITFGTGFKSTGTIATGTTSARYFNLTFMSDGVNLIETARTVAIA